MHMAKSRLGALVVLASVSGMTLAQGQTNSEWEHELTPYLWASRMKGEIASGSIPSTRVDMRFSDILENLDMGFMSAFESRKGRWSLLFDGMYMKVSDTATTSLPIGAANARAEVKQTSLAGAVGYKALEGSMPLDLIAGLRYSRIDVDVDINASTVLGINPSFSRSGAKSWTEPYLGAKLTVPVSERLKAIAYGDVGGFGVGSDLTWQAMFGVSYTYSKSVGMTFGYRYLDVDYDKDGFKYKMANDGIYTGISFRF